jgi:hypothetical protein
MADPTGESGVRRAVARWSALAVALVLLNVSLTFGNVWPTLSIRLSTEVSIELAALVGGLVLTWRWLRPRFRGGRRWLAAAWVALVVGRYVDVTARALYGRDVNLYWDLRYLPSVGAMFAEVATPWLTVAFLAVALALPVLLYVPTWWAIGRIGDAAGEPPFRRALGAAAGAVLLLWVAQGVGWSVPTVRFSEPVSPTYARELAQLAYEATGAGVRALGTPTPIRSDLAHVDGADVLLVFLESYGAVSWDRPAFAQSLAESRADFEAAIQETNRSVVSAFVESTTFGGESWLAHISLLSGTEVRDQGTNVRLMAQERDTLVKAFGRHGYRTVAVMPGLLAGWPQGAFYGFEEIYNLARLDYQGPPFGWWGITDQFALARMDELELEPQPRRPLFIFFPTITTHAPFTPAPPYQPDWDRILTPDPYDVAELNRAWSDQPDWLNLGPSYVKGLSYAYETLAGYLRHRPDRDLVMILIGDHQPSALVSGEGATWNVPVHVIASRIPVLERLRQRRFRDGLAPHNPIVARMDTLRQLLLQAFSSDDAS